MVNVYKAEKIENQSFWPKFLELVELRNKIVHQKSTNDTEYIAQLFDEKIFKICYSANELFSFFFANSLKRFDADTEMIGNEFLWPRIITYIPDMDIMHENIGSGP